MIGAGIGVAGGRAVVPEIVARAQARDADAFAALYEQHVNRIFAHVRARVGDEAVAEDLTAQTFLRAWQAIERYRPVAGRPFIAWLFAIANNLVVDHYRRYRRELIGVEDRPGADLGDPERRALDLELREEIRRAMGRLRGEHQLIVALRLVEGLSYDEVAAITGKRVGALRVTMCRALAQLRKELSTRGVRPT